MTTGTPPPGGRVDLRKSGRDAPEPRPGPAWIVVPARIVALVVVLPVRLVHDLLVAVGRGIRAGWNGLMRGLAAVGRGIGAVLHVLVVRPLRWLAVVVVLGFLRWFYRALLVPVGRFIALIGRAIGRFLDLVLVRPLRALGHGLAWCLGWCLFLLGHAFAYLVQGIGLLLKGIGLLLNFLLVLPAMLLWRYVLRPPLLGLAWLLRTLWSGLVRLARGVWAGLTWLGRGTLAVLAAVWGVIAAGAALLGRGLAWLGNVLIVVPARALWRFVLAPIAAALVGTWRLAGRVLRRLWRTLVVLPFRVLVVAPARRVRATVLRPVGRGIRSTWRVAVRDPVRSARRTMREARRDVRLQLRRVFRGY